MAHIRIMLGFQRISEQELIASAGSVVSGLTDNKFFTDPPVPPSVLQAAIDGLNKAIADIPHTGAAGREEKKERREALIALMRQLARYVELHCEDNMKILATSGFTAVTTTRISAALPKPTITGVDNGHSCQLLVNVERIANAKCYEVRTAPVGTGGLLGTWQQGGLFTRSRAMAVNNLQPGTAYTFQTRAVGGSTGYSDWSDPVSHMCM